MRRHDDECAREVAILYTTPPMTTRLGGAPSGVTMAAAPACMGFSSDASALLTLLVPLLTRCIRCGCVAALCALGSAAPAGPGDGPLWWTVSGTEEAAG